MTLACISLEKKKPSNMWRKRKATNTCAFAGEVLFWVTAIETRRGNCKRITTIVARKFTK